MIRPSLLPIIFISTTCLYADAPTPTPQEARVVQKARALQKEGKDAQAESALRRFAEKNERSSIVLVELGGMLFGTDRHEEAIQCYRKALAIAPEFGTAAKNLGRLLAMGDQMGEAITHLVTGMELNGPDAETTGVLAYCYLQTDKPAQAETCYRLARSLRPDRKDLAAGLAQSLYDQEDWARCAAVCHEITSRWPTDKTGWTLLANAGLGAGDDSGSLEAVLALHYLGADDPWILSTLGDLYARQEIPRPAVRSYLEAARTGRLSPHHKVAAAQALLTLDRAPQAQTLLREVLAQDPDPKLASRAHVLLASATDPTQAEKHLREAMKLDPTSALAIRRLADLLAGQKSYTDALDMYRLLEAQEGHETEAIRGRADVYLRQGKWEEALRSLRDLNERDPNVYLSDLIERVRDRARD